jgi:hypothetical protein
MVVGTGFSFDLTEFFKFQKKKVIQGYSFYYIQDKQQILFFNILQEDFCRGSF